MLLEQPACRSGVSPSSGHAVGVELGEPPGGRDLAVVEVGDRREQLELLLLGAHRGSARCRGRRSARSRGRRRRRSWAARAPCPCRARRRCGPGCPTGSGRAAAAPSRRRRWHRCRAARAGRRRTRRSVRWTRMPGKSFLSVLAWKRSGDGDLERVERQRGRRGWPAASGRRPSGSRGAARSRCGATVNRPPWSLTNVIAIAPQVSAPRAAEQLLDRPTGAGVVDDVDGAAQVGQQVALAGAAGAARDGVVGGAVELGVRRHHQRRVGVEDGALADARGAGDHRRVAAQRHDGEPVEAAPVDQLEQRGPPLHGVVGRRWRRCARLEETVGGRSARDRRSGQESRSALRGRRVAPRRCSACVRRARRRPGRQVVARLVPARRCRWRGAAPRAAPAAARAGAGARRPR